MATGWPRRRDPAVEPSTSTGEVRLEQGQALADQAGAFHDPGGPPTGLEGRGRIAPAMLQDLGHLDPADTRPSSTATPKIEPRLEGLIVPAQPTEEPSAIDQQGVPIVSTGGRGRTWLVGPGGQDRRPGTHQACRPHPRLEGQIEAGQGVLGLAQSPIGTPQSREVTDRREATLARIAKPRHCVGQEASQRANVFVVVADDLGQWCGRAAAQEVEIPTGDFPALDIAPALDPQQLGLDRSEAGVGQPVAEDPAHEWEQVEVTGMNRRRSSAHPVAGDQEGPVEATSVVGDQPCVGRDRVGEGVEQGGFLGVVGQEQLDLLEPVPDPGPDPDQKGDRSRPRREPGRLRVETDQGGAFRTEVRQTAQPGSVQGQHDRRLLDPDVAAHGTADPLTADGVGQPSGEVLGAPDQVPTAANPGDTRVGSQER